MAIVPEDVFPGQIAPADTEYPQGKARNVSAPSAGDGTPWNATLLNDIWGFLQKILAAGSVTPSGDPDTVLASDYYTALSNVFLVGAASLAASGKVQLVNTLGASDSLAATQSLVNAVSTALTPTLTGNASAWCLKWGKVKMQGGLTTANNDANTVVTFAGVQSAYTATHFGFWAGIGENNTVNDRQPLKSSVVNLSSGRISSTDDDNLTAWYVSLGLDS